LVDVLAAAFVQVIDHVDCSFQLRKKILLSQLALGIDPLYLVVHRIVEEPTLQLLYALRCISGIDALDPHERQQ